MDFQSVIYPPVVIRSPGLGILVVKVDTSYPAWPAGGSLTLTAPTQAGGRLFIKDIGGNANVEPIVVDGNGSLIDGEASVTLDTSYAQLKIFFDGSQWVRI